MQKVPCKSSNFQFLVLRSFQPLTYVLFTFSFTVLFIIRTDNYTLIWFRSQLLTKSRLIENINITKMIQFILSVNVLNLSIKDRFFVWE